MTDRELFEAYRTDVYYICYYMLHNSADAEDVCQEVFLKAFQVDRSGIERLKPWLLRIAVNQCDHQLGRRKVGVWKEMKQFLQQTLQAHEPADEAVLRIEREDDLKRWLQQLPIKSRVVLTLRYVHELSLQEIAESLDIPLGTVKSRLNAGLVRIKKHIEAERYPSERGAECHE
ncbi:RNA polymerase sigma factor [Paenibacillus sp. YYML68]|uniref:RNA polymerase sigma factor n=1 Tax=Paenibacillus sp. YYML68 TaxID=2909250 RepID=UPI002491C476|nr:RNA polymerase sigma factor [Paenibacillus sp. YYML68]